MLSDIKEKLNTLPKNSKVYFDIDGTILLDNPVTGKADIRNEFKETYLFIKNKRPDLSLNIITNRKNNEIYGFEKYKFEKYFGFEDQLKYIRDEEKKGDLNNSITQSLFKYFASRSYKNNSIPKLLFLYHKHFKKDESFLLIDDACDYKMFVSLTGITVSI